MDWEKDLTELDLEELTTLAALFAAADNQEKTAELVGLLEKEGGVSNLRKVLDWMKQMGTSGGQSASKGGKFVFGKLQSGGQTVGRGAVKGTTAIGGAGKSVGKSVSGAYKGTSTTQKAIGASILAGGGGVGAGYTFGKK